MPGECTPGQPIATICNWLCRRLFGACGGSQCSKRLSRQPGCPDCTVPSERCVPSLHGAVPWPGKSKTRRAGARPERREQGFARPGASPGAPTVSRRQGICAAHQVFSGTPRDRLIHRGRAIERRACLDVLDNSRPPRQRSGIRQCQGSPMYPPICVKTPVLRLFRLNTTRTDTYPHIRIIYIMLNIVFGHTVVHRAG